MDMENSRLVIPLDEREEKFILSRRRAVIFVFFVGVVMLSLLFLIRLDIDIKHDRIRERANLIKKITPVFREPVAVAINGVSDESSLPLEIVQTNQRDPRLLLGSMFGSLYNRTDYIGGRQ